MYTKHPILKSTTLCLILLIVLISGCKEKSTVAPTSDKENSSELNTIADEKAAELVAKMEAAMGGMDKWNDLRYVSWTFFGSRHLVWDKIGGRVRIDAPRDSSVYLVDLHNKTGRIFKGEKEITVDVDLDQMVKRAESIWINDSYWLVMPFKLRDPGVTVNYMREDTMIGGAPASVLELTFNNVGNTPNNKYEVYLDKEDDLIKQWAFFKTADQTDPPRIWPWDNYSSFDGLMISSDRSDKSGPSNVRVYSELDDKVFDSFEPFDYF